MKVLFGHLYDACGSCPECGRLLRPVRYYTGAESSRTDMGSRQVGKYTQTLYHVGYSDIREHRAGFCDACDRAEWDAKEADWPKPGKAGLIGGIIGGAALVTGILLMLFCPWRSLEGLASKNFGAIFVLLCGGGLFTLIYALGAYIGKRREYVRHKNGYRAPYVVKTEAELSEWAKNRAKPIPSDGRTYWNLTEFETMQKLNGGYFT